jgi:hypothetical protein
MNPDYYLRAGFIIVVALVFGTMEMKRRARVTEEAARQWLENSGYRVADTERMNMNVWVNPTRVVARVADAAGNAVDVELTVKWSWGACWVEGMSRAFPPKDVTKLLNYESENRSLLQQLDDWHGKAG